MCVCECMWKLAAPIFPIGARNQPQVLYQLRHLSSAAPPPPPTLKVGSHFIAQASLEFSIFLPQHPEC